jgi:hypothetical protein
MYLRPVDKPNQKCPLMLQRRRQLLLLIVAIAIGGLIPFETRVVPTWKIRVVDETGAPYASMRVRQSWYHYTLDPEPGGNSDTRWTDAEGYVEFPERRLGASIFSRVVRSAYAVFGKVFAHGGLGIQAYIDSSGPQGYRSIDYTPGKTLPNKLILPRGQKQGQLPTEGF